MQSHNSEERQQPATCPLCEHLRNPAEMKSCQKCGESYCKRCSGLRRAEALGYWSEQWHHVPPAWEGICKNCFDRWAEAPVTCASCGQEVASVDIFWGGPCDKCQDYTCYDCARTKQRAGGGWEAPGGVWDYRCRKHTGRFARGWRPPERPQRAVEN